MSDYCQFNLDFAGTYILGEKHDEDEHYFQVKNPTFCFKNLQKLNPSDDAIHLSKNAVVCYFKIERS